MFRVCFVSSIIFVCSSAFLCLLLLLVQSITCTVEETLKIRTDVHYKTRQCTSLKCYFHMQQPDMFSQAQGHISRSLVTCNAYDIIWKQIVYYLRVMKQPLLLNWKLLVCACSFGYVHWIRLGVIFLFFDIFINNKTSNICLIWYYFFSSMLRFSTLSRR